MLPGATVTVTNTDTRVTQTTVSDSQGHYTVTNLLPAPYDIEAALSGFQTVIRSGVRLVVGSEGVVDFTLGPSAVQETVTVTADAPVVDPRLRATAHAACLQLLQIAARCSVSILR